MELTPKNSKFERWREQLKGLTVLLRGPLRRRVDSSDVVQDGLKQLVRQNPDSGDVNEAYLASIGRGTVAKLNRFHRQQCRDVQREEALADTPAPASTPEAAQQQRELVARLAELVSTLSDREQRIIHYRIFEDKEFAEIATIMELTVRQCRYAYQCALDSLGRLLGSNPLWEQ